MSDFLNVTTNKAEVSDRHHGNRRRGVRYSIMAVWFCERHIDHNPNTPFSDFFQPYGVAPYAAGENRIGGHKNRSFLHGTVRPRVISECGNRTTQGLLLLKHALKQRKDQNFSGHLTWHCSVHPTGAALAVEHGSSGLASERSTISRCGVVARACMCLHHPLELGSMRRCNRAIRSWKER